LIKNAEALQKAGAIDTVILDKTGTITKGKPAVTDVVENRDWEIERFGDAASKTQHTQCSNLQSPISQSPNLSILNLPISSFLRRLRRTRQRTPACRGDCGYAKAQGVTLSEVEAFQLDHRARD
jgi:magnesium-transporting ATPase (P-type)